jgi:hypothetical protein
MKREVRYPPGCWPMEMPAELAAAFCGEISVDAFLGKVRLGVYSAPACAPHCRDKWHRMKLEIDIARRHNLQWATAPVLEDAAGLIA